MAAIAGKDKEISTKERLSRRLNQIRESKNEYLTKIPRVERGAVVPLSFAQQRLWFINQFEGGEDISYNMPWALRLEGELKVAALRKALQAIIRRHESLRTTFKSVGGGAVQVIANELKLDIPLIEIEESEIPDYLNQNARHIFNLSTGPLIKLSLLKCSPDKHVLLINMHHIISDGWARGVFNEELISLYTSYRRGEESYLAPLPIQYADFAHWQRQWLQGEILKQQLDYWQSQLEDAPRLLELSITKPRPAVQSYRGQELYFFLPSKIIQPLEELGQQQNATLYMVLMAAFNILLGRYSDKDDICIGLPIANRQQQELENLIGFFVNTLVLRTRVKKEQSFIDLLQQVKANTLAAYSHQDVPFEHLVEVLRPERSGSYMPLIQVVMVLQNAPNKGLDLPGLTITEVETEIRTSKFDINMSFTQVPKGLSGQLEYCTDLFDEEDIKRFIEHFQNLLEAIVKSPYRSIASLPLINKSEEHRILKDWSNASNSYAVNQCIHQRIEIQAASEPDLIALEFEGDKLSYKELNRRSNQLANYLLTVKHVKPEDRVGLRVSRTPEMVVAILGILKAGAAYVPLDPDIPSDRANYILADCGVSLLLTQADLEELIPDDQKSVTSIFLDHDWSRITEYGTQNPNVPVYPDNLAYVIYTSGSTGRPKGTYTTHANVLRLLAATEQHFSFNRNDVWTLFHSCAFDFSVWEIWGALFYGGKIVVVPYWVSRDPESFCKMVWDKEVTVLNQTPSAFSQFITADKTLGLDPNKLKLRYVIFGGEALDMAGLQTWFDSHGDTEPQLVNMYGITETTVHVTSYRINRDDTQQIRSIIGKQLPDLQCHILDEHLKLTPVVLPGELYVGGAGLARGYHERSDLTAERFIPNVFSKTPGERLYKTGDLGRRLESGVLEYLGRVDQQVKIRGFRIELGEIKARILEHPAIQTCEVVAREDGENKRLVGYIVPDQSYEIPIEDGSQQSSNIEAQWLDVFENNYIDANLNDPFNDFSGWNSSYDGEPIPEAQMRSWADDTAERILALQPKNILEIACGTGLLTGRLAPFCKSYTGTDFSVTVLKALKQKLPLLGEHSKKVDLVLGAANDLHELAGRRFDCIVLNSVVQYFPDPEYLAATLREAHKLLAPGGKIFLGDLRHLGLLRTFHTSVELHKSEDINSPIRDLRRRIEIRTVNDGEVVIEPGYFHKLQTLYPDIKHVQIMPKEGDYHKELSAYRYDVCLHFNEKPPLKKNMQFIRWSPEEYSFTQLEAHLRKKEPEVFALENIRNGFLTEDLQAFGLCHSSAFGKEEVNTVSELKSKLADIDEINLTPFQLKQLAKSIDYSVEFSWANSSEEGNFDVVFFRQKGNKNTSLLVDFPVNVKCYRDIPTKNLISNPLQQRYFRELGNTLTEHLKMTLPDYMVPSSLVTLDALPLTANGKVDHKALPVPDLLVLQTEEYMPPNTAVEKQLVNIWAEVLNLDIDLLGVNSNFFQLGGDSIISLQIIARARKQGLRFTPKQLFEYQTIAELARVVNTAKHIDAEQGQVTGEFALTPIQHWFFNQQLINYHHYNQAYLLEVPDTLQLDSISQAFCLLMKHHDSLRLRFENTNGMWKQAIVEWQDTDYVKLEHVDLSAIPPELQQEALQHEASSLQAQLDIEKGPILRAAWFFLGDGQKNRLLVVIHHLAVDGVSWRILLEDLETVYHQLVSGEAVDLPPKTTSYKSWSECLHSYAQSVELSAELDYWKALGKQDMPLISQDKRYEVNQNTSASSEVHIFELDEAHTRDLLYEVPKAYNTEINDVLLTALMLAFHEWTGNKTLLFDLEGHGREHLFSECDLSRTVGWFTSIFPVSLTLPSDVSLGSSLKSIKEQLRKTPNKGIGYGVLRYCLQEPSVTDGLASGPVPQVSFNYLGQLDQTVRKGKLFHWAKESVGASQDPQQARLHIIDINSVVIDNRLRIDVHWNSAIQDENTIKTLSANIRGNLQKLIVHCLSVGVGGYTPSDFPEANLDSHELDKLLENLEIDQ